MESVRPACCTRPVRVFLSSMFIDLEEERNAVYERLRHEFDVVRMEDFGARNKVPVETCVSEVESSDVYVLILGHRYGSLAPGYGASYTQVEYEAARENDIPVLAYVRGGIDEALDVADDPLRLADFYNDISGSHTLRRPFHSPADLADQVHSRCVAVLRTALCWTRTRYHEAPCGQI
jgi:hypothetical protein